MDPNGIRPGDDIVTDADKPINGPYEVTRPRTITETVRLPVQQASAGTIPLPTTVPAPIGWLPILAPLLESVVPSQPMTYPATRTRKVSVREPAQFWYVTYTKYNPITDKVYVGCTSGYGTPDQIVRQRDAGHKDKNAERYQPAKTSSAIPATLPGGYDNRFDDPSYWAIRESEQIQIEYWRGLGKSGNKINGIGSKNHRLNLFLDTARKLFPFLC